MPSPLPLLRSTLQNFVAVPSMTGVPASAEQGAVGDSLPSRGEAGLALETSTGVHVSAPISSLSSGENPVHIRDNSGDIVVGASQFDEAHQRERHRDRGKTSFEHSPSPEQSPLRVVTGAHSGCASPAAGALYCEVEDERGSASRTTSPAQGVWTHHVYFQPTAAARDNSVTALSDAAARMIAHAVHRSSLLQKCFTQWQIQQERHAQQRLRLECFAEGYYQRNLLYLFFRAWQWRYDRRAHCAQQRRKLEALRARHLCSRAFRAWQRWKNERRGLWRRLDEMQARMGRTLLRQFFERWHRTSTHRARVRAAAQASADSLRAARFRHWQHAALRRQRGRLFASVVMLHTPSAWADAQKLRFEELHRRYVWIQWLRVAVQRRARQLHRYEDALSAVTTRTAHALLQRRYVWWLQVTCAALQLRQMQRGLLQRYYKRLTVIGRLSVIRLAWEREAQTPHVRHRCFLHWRSRVGKRETNREHLRIAEFFFESVVQAHVVHAAFHFWRASHSSRVKAKRMRRVAEEYARPALLRHLFLRRVTDGVLASPTGLEEALQHDVWRRGDGVKVVKAKSNVIDPNENSTLDAPTKTSGTSSTRLRPPIPLRNHCHAFTGKTTIPVACLEAPLESDRRSNQGEVAGAVCPIRDLDAGHVADMEVLRPPPPSYEEVMSSWRMTDTSTRIGSCALPMRADIGVGTRFEAPAPVQCATPCVGITGDRSAAHPNIVLQREEVAPVPVSAVSGLGVAPAVSPSLWPAVVPCYSVPNGAPVSWSLGLVPVKREWPALDTRVPLSVSVTPSGSATPSYHRVYCAPPSDVVPAAAESPSCAAFGRTCAESFPQHVSGEYGRRAPAARPSPALPHPCEGIFPTPLSPRIPYSFDVHRHVDPLAPLAQSFSTPNCAEGLGCVDSPGPRRHRDDEVQRPCVGPPAVTLGNAIVSQGRVPLSFVGRCVRSKKHTSVPSPERRSLRDLQSAHTTFCSSSCSSSRSSSTFDAPQASDVAPFPLCSPFSISDSSTLRKRARAVLDDYKRRTRLITGEKAELATVESQLTLTSHTKNMVHKRELSKRRRYLQQRLLEWEQRRAQIAQLAVWLEGCVSAATSRAASEKGTREL